MMTRTTGLAGCIEPIYLTYFTTVLGCYMLQLLDERGPAEIGDLSAPKSGHAREVQVLDAEDVVLPAQLVSEFPLPVVATISNLLMQQSQRMPCCFAVIRAFLALGKPS